MCDGVTSHSYKVLGKWPTWRTILFYAFISISTRFEQPRIHHQENQLYRYNIWYMSLCVSDRYTKRSPTQSDIYQMLYWYNWFSWWWARGCSKRVENWNKRIEKNCASSWSFTKNRNKMHGQQNIKFCTQFILYITQHMVVTALLQNTGSCLYQLTQHDIHSRQRASIEIFVVPLWDI